MLGRIAKVFLIGLAVSLLTAAFAAAQAPTTISYQGRLADASGQPLTDPPAVFFAIYAAPTGGTALYTSPAMNIHPDANGVFTVELGPFAASVFDGSKRYLGIKVGTDAEMTPRQLLTSGPYALGVADAPGIAFRESTPANIFRNFPPGTTALDSISIIVPGPGYVYVWAHTDVSVDHNIGTRDEIYLQVSTTPASISYSNYGFTQIMVPSELPTQTSRWYTYSCDAHRPFYVSAAGTYKYYLNGNVSSGAGDNDSFFDLQITAMYFPTAYGTVDKAMAEPGDGSGQVRTGGPSAEPTE
jgi:hypothetical protein